MLVPRRTGETQPTFPGCPWAVCGRVHPSERVWQSNSGIGATEGCRSVDCWFGGLSKLDGQGIVLAGPAFEPPSPNLPGWRIIVRCRVAVRRIVAIGGSSSRTGSRANCDTRCNRASTIVWTISTASHDGCSAVSPAHCGSTIGATVGSTAVWSTSRYTTGRPSGDCSAIGAAHRGSAHWAAISSATTRSCYGSPAERIRRR
jgi:hypothetical protein